MIMQDEGHESAVKVDLAIIWWMVGLVI